MNSAARRLRSRIRASGPIPFAAFMEEALYGEGGYYARPDLPIGRDGDYVTGSSLSSLFGRATARLLRRLDRPLETVAELLEAGYGTGAHLGAVVAALGPEPGRRLRGWDRVARPLPPGVERVNSLPEVEPGEVLGLVFSYELFDALPVHRLIGRPGGGLGELWVGVGPAGGFRWREGPLSDPSLAGLVEGAGATLEVGQIADLSPGWSSLYRQLAERLGRGLVVTCDYGFGAGRLLDPRVRRGGTLACYRRHTVHRDPLVDVGRQDLTAHVDFTSLRRTGEALGLRTVAFTRQARWLTACGLFEDLRGGGSGARREAMALLDPEGMGEEVRVLVQCRGIEAPEVFDLDVLGGRELP